MNNEKIYLFIWLQRRQEQAEMEAALAAAPGSIEPPQVNICPPSPANNEDPKTANFAL